jgi:hypothetical protein
MTRIDYDFFDTVLFPAQGLSEIVRRGLDLTCESLGAVLRRIEDGLARGVQQA